MIMLYPIVYTVICICLIGNRLGPLQGGREGRTPGPGGCERHHEDAKVATLKLIKTLAARAVRRQ